MGEAAGVGESLRTRLFRAAMNLYPAYRGTGGRVVRISADWREVLVRLPLGWRTRNYFGTIFGGSIYAAVDPFYALMLIKNLGEDYVVWDKAASIRFRRPGRETLYARFVLGEDEIRDVRAATADGTPSDRRYTVNLRTAAGEVCAVVEKVVYVRRKVPQATRDREVG